MASQSRIPTREKWACCETFWMRFLARYLSPSFAFSVAWYPWLLVPRGGGRDGAGADSLLLSPATDDRTAPPVRDQLDGQHETPPRDPPSRPDPATKPHPGEARLPELRQRLLEQTREMARLTSHHESIMEENRSLHERVASLERAATEVAGLRQRLAREQDRCMAAEVALTQERRAAAADAQEVSRGGAT